MDHIEKLVEGKIKEAMEKGEFDNLPGKEMKNMLREVRFRKAR
jgi:hypothetical protein